MIAHPSLLKNLICPILLTIIWGLAAVVFGFAYLLKLQAHALIAAKCPAAVAWYSTSIPFCHTNLGESMNRTCQLHGQDVNRPFNHVVNLRIVCVIFVLLEVAVLSILFYLIIVPIYQDALFDRVLKLRGLKHVLKRNEGNDLIKCMRGVSGGLWILFFQVR